MSLWQIPAKRRMLSAPKLFSQVLFMKFLYATAESFVYLAVIFAQKQVISVVISCANDFLSVIYSYFDFTWVLAIANIFANGHI